MDFKGNFFHKLELTPFNCSRLIHHLEDLMECFKMVVKAGIIFNNQFSTIFCNHWSNCKLFWILKMTVMLKNKPGTISAADSWRVKDLFNNSLLFYLPKTLMSQHCFQFYNFVLFLHDLCPFLTNLFLNF